MEKTRAKISIPIEHPRVYHQAEKPDSNAACEVPTVEDPPTNVPMIPPKTKYEETDFFPLKSLPFCFLEDTALTERIKTRIANRPKYIID